MTINLRMKELRGSRTQEEVATQIGLNRQTYRYYESGERNADYETLFKIADFYRVSIDYLLGHDIQEKKPALDKQAEVYKPYGIDLTDTIPLPEHSKADIDILIDKLTPNQRSLVWEYTYMLTDQMYEVKHWNETRFNFIRHYKELIDNPFFRYIMELFLHIKPKDYGDIMEMFCRILEKKGYNTTKYFIEVANYFDDPEHPVVFTTTAISDKFVEDYQQLILDENFIKTTKLFNNIDASVRLLVYNVVREWLYNRGIPVKTILGE